MVGSFRTTSLTAPPARIQPSIHLLEGTCALVCQLPVFQLGTVADFLGCESAAAAASVCLTLQAESVSKGAADVGGFHLTLSPFLGVSLSFFALLSEKKKCRTLLFIKVSL